MYFPITKIYLNFDKIIIKTNNFEIFNLNKVGFMRVVFSGGSILPTRLLTLHISRRTNLMSK